MKQPRLVEWCVFYIFVDDPAFVIYLKILNYARLLQPDRVSPYSTLWLVFAPQFGFCMFYDFAFWYHFLPSPHFCYLLLLNSVPFKIKLAAIYAVIYVLCCYTPMPCCYILLYFEIMFDIYKIILFKILCEYALKILKIVCPMLFFFYLCLFFCFPMDKTCNSQLYPD